jgi:hypothetical protein
MRAARLPQGNRACRRPFKGQRVRSGAGWFEQRKARERGRERLLVEHKRAREEIGRHDNGPGELRRDVGQAMATVAWQRLFGRDRRRALVIAQSHR